MKDGAGNRITDQNNVGNLNPFRYRGYYYDTESQLNYLMSRYYDPVTHRFINADGYFQAGNAILDANMNAYCRNNPVSYEDSLGMSCHYTGDFKYHPGCHTSPYDGFCNSCGVRDCCYPEDRVIPEKAKPSEPTIVDKVVQTAVVILTSPQLDIGAGYGLGASTEVLYDIGVDFVMSADLMHIKLSREGFDIGSELHAAAGISVGPGYLGWDETYWQSWINDPVYTCGPKTNVDILSLGAYAIIGGQISISIDTDYIAKGVADIWG